MVIKFNKCLIAVDEFLFLFLCHNKIHPEVKSRLLVSDSHHCGIFVGQLSHLSCLDLLLLFLLFLNKDNQSSSCLRHWQLFFFNFFFFLHHCSFLYNWFLLSGAIPIVLPALYPPWSITTVPQSLVLFPSSPYFAVCLRFMVSLIFGFSVLHISETIQFFFLFQLASSLSATQNTKNGCTIWSSYSTQKY